ncbi:MAG: hypothetical protein ABJP34_09095 [Erythrobacter sp.]
MPSRGEKPEFPDPRTDDIMAGDRRISRPDSSLPDWEMPDAAYRPVPIVWFFTAFLGQIVSFIIAFKIGLSFHPFFTVILCALLTGMIGRWTWGRGMAQSARGWKIATIAMLGFQLGIAALFAYALMQTR